VVAEVEVEVLDVVVVAVLDVEVVAVLVVDVVVVAVVEVDVVDVVEVAVLEVEVDAGRGRDGRRGRRRSRDGRWCWWWSRWTSSLVQVEGGLLWRQAPERLSGLPVSGIIKPEVSVQLVEIGVARPPWRGCPRER